MINKFTLLLKDSANYLNRTERYGLMLVNEAEGKKNIDKNTINYLYDKLISNIEKFKYDDWKKNKPVVKQIYLSGI